MDRVVKALALVVGLFAAIFLFVGLLWTELPQAIVGILLAVAAALIWTASSRIATRRE
jgi:drug/metabolite transporter (DMT)-like permease